jgi:hypothetical protein
LVERSASASLVRKDATPGAISVPGGWLEALPAPLATAFANYAAGFSILGRFGVGGVPSLTRVPFDVAVAAGDPGASSAAWVQEGGGKPARIVTLARILLHPAKVAAVTVITNEVARLAAAGSVEFLRDQLARSLAIGLDRVFCDPAISAGANSPASVTNGISPISATTDPATDLRQLVAAYAAGGGSLSAAVILCSSATAAALALTSSSGASLFPGVTVAGGVLAGVPCLASDAVGARIILVDTSRIFVADNGEADVSVAEHASVEMVDAPSQSIADGSPLAPSASSLVSLWQTDSIGLRVERIVSWATAPGAVAFLSDVDYLNSGSPA